MLESKGISRSVSHDKNAAFPKMAAEFVQILWRSKSKCDLLRAQDLYAYYCAQHSARVKRANQTLLKTRILPGLSLYMALCEQNSDQQKVLSEVDVLFKTAFFTRRMRAIRILNYVTNPFFVVKPMLKLMTRHEYEAGAQEIIEDSANCFALNVYRCFILDTLTEHNAKELTSLYCNTDDWLAAALPKISWERTKTLGRGGDCCDFRWCRRK